MKLNEAEAFLQGKISGKILNFSDFVNENKDEMEPSEYDIVLYALRDVPKNDIDIKIQILKLAAISCTPDEVFDTFEDFIDNSENIMEIYDIKYGIFQKIDKLLIKNNYINAALIQKVKKQINESINEDSVIDGYGNQAFYFAKNGDTSNYFFKLTDGKEQMSYVISIGKFAKFVQPTEAKANYGVITLTQLKEEALDQAVIDKGIFQTNSEMINVSEGQVTKLLNHLGIIIEDYLQKNPQINKFYDEMQSSLQTPQFENKLSVSLANFPGGNSVWSLQSLEPGKVNIIQK